MPEVVVQLGPGNLRLPGEVAQGVEDALVVQELIAVEAAGRPGQRVDQGIAIGQDHVRVLLPHEVLAHPRTCHQVQRLELTVGPGVPRALGRTSEGASRALEGQVGPSVDRRSGCTGQVLVPDTHDVDALCQTLERAAEGGRLATPVDSDDGSDDAMGAVHDRRCTPSARLASPLSLIVAISGPWSSAIRPATASPERWVRWHLRRHRP